MNTRNMDIAARLAIVASRSLGGCGPVHPKRQASQGARLLLAELLDGERIDWANATARRELLGMRALVRGIHFDVAEPDLYALSDEEVATLEMMLTSKDLELWLKETAKRYKPVKNEVDRKRGPTQRDGW